jgi:hypothetical protein
MTAQDWITFYAQLTTSDTHEESKKKFRKRPPQVKVAFLGENILIGGGDND